MQVPTSLAQLLWLISPLIQLVLVAVMIRRRLHREFPMFFAYNVFRSTTALLIFFLYKTHFLVGHLYGYASLAHETGCIVLRFAAIYEIFSAVLEPYSVLRVSARAIFRWGAAVLLVLGVIVAVSHKIGPYTTLMETFLNLMDRTVDFIQCGLLLALMMWSRYLRLSWRKYSFGIAIGLGIFAAIDLAGAAILLESFRIPFAQRALLAANIDVVTMAAYLVSVLVWLAYAAIPETVPRAVVSVPEHDLDSWNHELQRLLQR